MLSPVFSTLRDFDEETFRNVPAPLSSAEAFGDLLDQNSAADSSAVAAALVDAMPPGPSFDSHYFRAVGFPFAPGHLAVSRFSDGSFAVLCTSLEIETTVYESGYHWIVDNAELYRALGYWPKAQRSLYAVRLRALLLDLAEKQDLVPDLVSNDYRFCQEVGKRIHREGLPGLLAPSARRPGGTNADIFRVESVQGFALRGRCRYEMVGGRLSVAFEPAGAEQGAAGWPQGLAVDMSDWL